MVRQCTATISVKRVLDGGKKTVSLKQALLSAREIPRDAVAPYTFVNIVSIQSTAIAQDLTVTRLTTDPTKARVQSTVNIPMQVTFNDSTGRSFRAATDIILPQDNVLYIPESSVFPFEIVTSASGSSTIGVMDANGIVTTDICVMVMQKVTTDADIIVCTQGYNLLPELVEYDSCEEFMNQPLYPCGQQQCL